MRPPYSARFAPLLSSLALLSPLALFTLVPIFGTGCNTARLTPAPDASPDCRPTPEFPCAIAEAGVPGCGPLASPTSQVEHNFDIDASYPQGCTILVDDPTPDDSNHCVQLGSCRCDADDAGALAWRCLPPTP